MKLWLNMNENENIIQHLENYYKNSLKLSNKSFDKESNDFLDSVKEFLIRLKKSLEAQNVKLSISFYSIFSQFEICLMWSGYETGITLAFIKKEDKIKVIYEVYHLRVLKYKYEMTINDSLHGYFLKDFVKVMKFTNTMIDDKIYEKICEYYKKQIISKYPDKYELIKSQELKNDDLTILLQFLTKLYTSLNKEVDFSYPILEMHGNNIYFTWEGVNELYELYNMMLSNISKDDKAFRFRVFIKPKICDLVIEKNGKQFTKPDYVITNIFKEMMSLEYRKKKYGMSSNEFKELIDLLRKSNIFDLINNI